jgi:threonine dehydratase
MTIERIEQAYKTIRQVLNDTPLTLTQTFSQMSGAQLYMKCENLQKAGSFKVRGAYNKITALVKEQPVKQVIASSAGNHAQGVAFAASALGIASTIVMPQTAPIAKISATKGYGASVVLAGSCFDDAYTRAREIQQETGAAFVHAFEDEDIIAGQGSVAIEILKDLPTVDTVLVPAGGGGLLSGIASYLKLINPRIKVIGVQAQGADAVVK